MYYAWYHTDHMHFHATKLYGHLGHTQAQAMTAEKYLHGKGNDVYKLNLYPLSWRIILLLYLENNWRKLSLTATH